jgi:hypothetical protein
MEGAYKACSKMTELLLKILHFTNILSTVPFKVVPSTGDTPFPKFLPLLECFLERTFCDGAQFSYRIFLNLRVFKKRPNFINSSPAIKDGALFKKFGLFLNTGEFFLRCSVELQHYLMLQTSRLQFIV